VRQIEKEGLEVERIHSDRTQSQRVDALQGMRQGEHRVLVATDIAARGIDIPTIGHIINYNVPQTVEDYIHRAGRTARGSSAGVVSTIATWWDKAMIKEIERELGDKLPRFSTPGVEAYVERRTTIRGRQRIRRRLL
jgi:ATP-dependent RNA helicase RhlE